MNYSCVLVDVGCVFHLRLCTRLAGHSNSEENWTHLTLTHWLRFAACLWPKSKLMRTGVGSSLRACDRWTTITNIKLAGRRRRRRRRRWRISSSFCHCCRSDDAQAWHWRLKRIGMYQLYYPDSKQKAKRAQNAIEHLSSGYQWHHHQSPLPYAHTNKAEAK